MWLTAVRARIGVPNLLIHTSIGEAVTWGRRLRTLAAYVGPGYMVAVGYMDPGACRERRWRWLLRLFYHFVSLLTSTSHCRQLGDGYRGRGPV